MEQDWETISHIALGSDVTVERVYIKDLDLALEGQFRIPPLASLSNDDQIFVSAFIRSHGSIKKMESLFGVSYPTIKSRLNKISKDLGFLEVRSLSLKERILSRLECGEITVDKAIEELQG